MTTNEEIITVLNTEPLKRKDNYNHFEMKFESVNDYSHIVEKSYIQLNNHF